MAMAVATVMAGQRADEWDGDDVLMTMISLTATKTTINKKYDEGGWMGSSSPLRCCSGKSAENRRKQVPTMVVEGHRMMTTWKMTMTYREVEGRSATRTTEQQEGQLGATTTGLGPPPRDNDVYRNFVYIIALS